MKTIRVQQVYYTIPELYRMAAGSKARRGMAGYAIKTGRADNTVFGGAIRLLCDLESLEKNERYALDKRETAQITKDIVGCAEAAMAGAFHKYELTEREIRDMIRNLERVPLFEGGDAL